MLMMIMMMIMIMMMMQIKNKNCDECRCYDDICKGNDTVMISLGTGSVGIRLEPVIT
jgi:hypothetical protein